MLATRRPAPAPMASNNQPIALPGRRDAIRAPMAGNDRNASVMSRFSRVVPSGPIPVTRVKYTPRIMSAMVTASVDHATRPAHRRLRLFVSITLAPVMASASFQPAWLDNVLQALRKRGLAELSFARVQYVLKLLRL